MIKEHIAAIQREIREKYGVEADIDMNIWAKEKSFEFALGVRDDLKGMYRPDNEYHHKLSDVDSLQVEARSSYGVNFSIFCKKEE